MIGFDKTKQEDSYLTAGEAAREMGTTVRTLQYYDREGLLKPAAISEGGRRLYSDAELVKLHQILSMKDLGFSLADIKGKLSDLSSPQCMVQILQEQSAFVETKIESLQEQKRIIDFLSEEVSKMQKVDFRRCADIIFCLKSGNEFCFAITHMDDSSLNHLRGSFDTERGREINAQLGQIQIEVLQMIDEGVASDSPEAIELAKKWWWMTIDILDGDFALLEYIADSTKEAMSASAGSNQRHLYALEFIKPALEAYFESDPDAAEELAALMSSTSG
jgi:DNA-binding transcriptional MerR regulator